LARSESFAIAIDFANRNNTEFATNHPFDIIVEEVAFTRRFLRETTESGGAWWPFVNVNKNPRADAPDLEWTIGNISALRARFAPGTSGAATWSFKMVAMAASFEDSGVGEDYVPSALDVTAVTLAKPNIVEMKVETATTETGSEGSSLASSSNVVSVRSTLFLVDDESNEAGQSGQITSVVVIVATATALSLII
jgi:hypothetical protein